MTNCKRYKVAAIDLGTVSSRLVLAQVEGGAIVESSKHTEITDLGEGVDATRRFCEAAVERVLAACRMFVDEARAFGAVCVCTTCTSAARDASNAALLLDGLRELELKPQVIPGEVEARLTFFGVAHDFAGERIIVADSRGETKRRNSRYTKPVIAETMVSLTAAIPMRARVEEVSVWMPIRDRTPNPTIPATMAATRKDT